MDSCIALLSFQRMALSLKVSVKRLDKNNKIAKFSFNGKLLNLGYQVNELIVSIYLLSRDYLCD